MGIWTLASIQAKIRSLTGRYTENQLASTLITIYINNYYQGVFPELMNLETREGFWQFSTTALDTGLYPFDASVIVARPPCYCITSSPAVAEDEPWVETEDDPQDEVNIDQNQLRIFTQPEDFFNVWPQSQTYERDQPTDGLLWRRNLYVMPPPDQIYTMQIQARLSMVSGFVNPTDAPEQDNWGYAIAYGAAIEICNDKGDNAKAGELIPFYEFYLNLCERREIRNLEFKRAVPHF